MALLSDFLWLPLAHSDRLLCAADLILLLIFSLELALVPPALVHVEPQSIFCLDYFPHLFFQMNFRVFS